MPEPMTEKRAMQRFPFQLPIALRKNGDFVRLFTNNVSARGICFQCKASLAEGEAIHFTMTLPREITLTEAIEVRCVARVIRVDRSVPTENASVAAVIERYEFLGET